MGLHSQFHRRALPPHEFLCNRKELMKKCYMSLLLLLLCQRKQLMKKCCMSLLLLLMRRCSA